MIKVVDILKYMEKIAPIELKESFDNVGLLVGDKESEVSGALIALDITPNVIDEAISTGCNLIVAHHPIIFTALKSVTNSDFIGKMVITAIKNDISIICMHTNLDSAEDGVNDALAQKLNLKDIENFGAGDSLSLGRVGQLENEMEFDEFLTFVKEKLGSNGIKYVGTNKVKKVSVLGGSGGKLMDLAIKNGSDTYVTADCTYDTFQKALYLGLNLIDAGHFATENVICEVLRKKLSENFKIPVKNSQKHHDIISFR